MATVVIDRRFRGPPDSANGGYACAMAARWIEGPAEVTLRTPPPLEKPLRVERRADGVALLDGDVLIAEARPARLELDAPDPVSMDAAQRGASHYPWRERHPYPTCFVCGPRRDAGDGLRIFPGPVGGKPLYAAPWTPPASLADARGNIRDEFVWAALDCPSGIVTDELGDLGLILLGRMAADLMRPLPAGQPYVVQAWPVSRDGRKLHTASALFCADGTPCAVARAVWIELTAKD